MLTFSMMMMLSSAVAVFEIVHYVAIPLLYPPQVAVSEQTNELSIYPSREKFQSKVDILAAYCSL
jgi:hypothetical protein